MARVVFGTLVFLVVVNVISGCAVTSGTVSTGKSASGSGKSGSKSRNTREVDSPITLTQNGLGLLLRPRNTKIALKDTQVEEVFRQIDANSDGMVDAAEWVNFSKETSIRDFVDLLNYADVNDDEAFSLKEFLSVQIVKIDQSEDKEGKVDMTS